MTFTGHERISPKAFGYRNKGQAISKVKSRKLVDGRGWRKESQIPNKVSRAGRVGVYGFMSGDAQATGLPAQVAREKGEAASCRLMDEGRWVSGWQHASDSLDKWDKRELGPSSGVK